MGHLFFLYLVSGLNFIISWLCLALRHSLTIINVLLFSFFYLISDLNSISHWFWFCISLRHSFVFLEILLLYFHISGWNFLLWIWIWISLRHYFFDLRILLYLVSGLNVIHYWLCISMRHNLLLLLL